MDRRNISQPPPPGWGANPSLDAWCIRVAHQVQGVSFDAHGAHYSQCPSYLVDSVVRTAFSNRCTGLHYVNTQRLAYIQPRVRTKFDDRSFSNNGHRIWNTVPANANLHAMYVCMYVGLQMFECDKSETQTDFRQLTVYNHCSSIVIADSN